MPSARFLSNVFPPLLLLGAIIYVISSSAKLSGTAVISEKTEGMGSRLANTFNEYAHDLSNLASNIGDTHKRPKYYDDDEAEQFDLSQLKNTI